MMKKLTCVLFVVALGACGGGGDDGDGNQPADANQTPKDAAIDAPTVDAPPATVMTVNCAGATIAQTVTTSGFAFSPSAITINVNDIVQFMPESAHNVVPSTNGTPTDPGLRSGAVGAIACLKFTVAGEFNYRCQPHSSMTGKVTVQ